MPTKSKATVELRFDDGTAISAWQQVRFRDRYTDPLGSLQFTTHPPAHKRSEYRERLQKGRLVSFRIDGKPQITPIITTSRETITEQGVVFSIEAKSVLDTPSRGSVDPNLNLSSKADTPVQDIVLAAMKAYGFEEIKADTSAAVAAMTGRPLDGRKPAVIVEQLKHRDVQPQPNESAYNFAQRIFARYGLVLRVDPFGTLLLGSPDYDQKPAYALIQQRGHSRIGNRMLPPIEIVDTNDGQHSHCVVTGRRPDGEGTKRAAHPRGGVRWSGFSVPAGSFGSASQLKELPGGRHVYRSNVAGGYCPKFLSDKKSREVEWCENWGARILGERAIHGWQLRCEVEGLVASSGAIWTVDTIAHVYAEVAEIDEELWVYEVTKSADRGGQRTSLTLVPKHSLVLSTTP